ncbi:hypothetical protein F511_18217 [Dorcoceras hygrometricum]|uniref:Uncharacterized protein n=1 Tax=Dorcoceras hygrometricum TaxID=472368 RepID=A0A2Z7BMZ6_9LAMI|nr:hypothetical protein F511_18217 [Dorcoceras hygrometricum]
MVKRLATSPHDPLGITDSACKNQSIVVSVQYGPFNPYIPIRSTTIGKSRVAKNPITMHTSWRSNSDITSVTSIGYPRMSASGESSTTMHRLLHASRSHPIPTPDDPKPEPNPRRNQTSRHDIAGDSPERRPADGGATNEKRTAAQQPRTAARIIARPVAPSCDQWHIQATAAVGQPSACSATSRDVRPSHADPHARPRRTTRAKRGASCEAAEEHKKRPGDDQYENNNSINYSIGYPRMSASGESSTTMHRLLHASGSHPISPPDDLK